MDELFVDFINTGWYITHETCRDPLQGSAWVDALLTRAGAGDTAGAYDAGRLVALRESLAAAVDKLIEAGRPDDGQIAALNDVLRGLPVLWQIGQDNAGFSLIEKPAVNGTDYALYLILKSFAAFLAGGEAGYLRRCGNGECRWLFIDGSKSHTRKWCSNTCASLIKVRRHRSRKRQDA